MATRETDGARWERPPKKGTLFFFSGCRPRFARLAASPLASVCTSLTKPEGKERLLAVYDIDSKREHFSLHDVIFIILGN